MAGLQTVTTPVTGTPISSTTFGVPVANNLTVLANPPIAKMRNSVGQSIPNNTSTALTWDTEDFDTVGGHSTVTATSRYVCQTGYAGYYVVRAAAAWASSATGLRDIWIAVNGTETPGSMITVEAPPAGVWSQMTETTVLLAVGDYVEAVVLQTSGGALSTDTGGASSARQSRLEIQWIHA